MEQVRRTARREGRLFPETGKRGALGKNTNWNDEVQTSEFLATTSHESYHSADKVDR